MLQIGRYSYRGTGAVMVAGPLGVALVPPEWAKGAREALIGRAEIVAWLTQVSQAGADAAVLDLAGLPAATDAARRVRREEVLIYDCRVEYDRAAAKHAVTTPYHPSMSDVHRAAILIEEVGEVARALTPDAAAPTGHAGDLRAELVQVATMALAWAARILDHPRSRGVYTTRAAQ